MTEGEKMSVSTIKYKNSIVSGSSHNFLINLIHNEWVNLFEEAEIATMVPAKHTTLTGGISTDASCTGATYVVAPDFRWIKIIYRLAVDYKTAMAAVVDKIKMCRYTSYQNGRKKTRSVMFIDNIFYLPSLSVAVGYNRGPDYNLPQELISVITEPAFYVPQGVKIGKSQIDEIALYNPERTIKYALGVVLNKEDYENFDYQNVEIFSIGDWVLETMSEEYCSPSFDNDPYIKMGNEILKEYGISRKGFIKTTGSNRIKPDPLKEEKASDDEYVDLIKGLEILKTLIGDINKILKK